MDPDQLHQAIQCHVKDGQDSRIPPLFGPVNWITMSWRPVSKVNKFKIIARGKWIESIVSDDMDEGLSWAVDGFYRAS